MVSWAPASHRPCLIPSPSAPEGTSLPVCSSRMALLNEGVGEGYPLPCLHPVFMPSLGSPDGHPESFLNPLPDPTPQGAVLRTD